MGRFVLAPAAVLLLLGVALAGCGGPYAKDAQLDPSLRPPESPNGRFRFEAGTDELLPTNGTVPLDGHYRLTGYNGAEPSIGVTASGAVFLVSYDQTLRSTDPTFRKWEPVFDFAPTLGSGGTETGDPMLFVDQVTDTVYTSHMFPSTVCLAMAASSDDGASWTENQASCTLPGLDHQKFFAAVPGPLAPPMAGQDHPTVLYQCYQRVFGTEALPGAVPEPPVQVPFLGGRQPTGTTHCNISYDGGVSWPAETLTAANLPGGVSCGGINGPPAAAADGTVVVPLNAQCDGLYLDVSLDSGLTWTLRPGLTAVGGASIDPDVAFGPDGTLYALWAGRDHLTYLARTKDLGLTWEGPWRVSPPGIQSTVFQVVSAGDDGRLAFAFLGTTTPSPEPSQAPDEARWHMFIGRVDDARTGVPLVDVVQVTGEGDPVQTGCVWEYGGGHPCRNMLDFNDAAVAPDGRFLVAFTKGCAAGCATPQDKTSLTAVAWADGIDLRGAAS